MISPDDIPDAVKQAASALRRGEAIVIPTDTVYGLAALPTNQDAIEKVFELKGRPRDLELPVLVSSLEQAESIGVFDDATRNVANKFWPGALTLVVDRRDDFVADIGTSRLTVGIRLPDHDFVRALCDEVGPIATTSANAHGKPPSITAEEAQASLGEDILVFDEGIREGVPSSVVRIAEEISVIREGAISLAEIISAYQG